MSFTEEKCVSMFLARAGVPQNLYGRSNIEGDEMKLPLLILVALNLNRKEVCIKRMQTIEWNWWITWCAPRCDAKNRKQFVCIKCVSFFTLHSNLVGYLVNGSSCQTFHFIC